MSSLIYWFVGDGLHTAEYEDDARMALRSLIRHWRDERQWSWARIKLLPANLGGGREAWHAFKALGGK